MLKGVTQVQAVNHYNYLVRAGKLNDQLKAGGKVVKAQATTTKRSKVSIESQMRWFSLIDSVEEEQVWRNLPEQE